MRSRSGVDHHFSARDNLFFRWTERRINNWIPVGDLGFRTPDAINRNYGGGLFHVFGSNLMLEVRGGVATQPTEDAPFEHELGLGAAGRLAAARSLRGLHRRGLEHAVDQPAEPRRAGPARAAEPELECRRRPDAGCAARTTSSSGSRCCRSRACRRTSSARSTTAPKRHAIRRTRPTTGDPIASALLGLPSRIQGFVPDEGYIDFHTSTLSGYVQDQWSLRPNLTLTYGLRYDYVTRVLGRLRLPERPRHEHRRMADRPRDDAAGVHGPGAAVPAGAAAVDSVQPVHQGHRRESTRS